jgi:hypothetical protein
MKTIFEYLMLSTLHPSLQTKPTLKESALQRRFKLYILKNQTARYCSQIPYSYTSPVSDLYIPMIGPPILLQPNMQTDRGNI